MRHLFFLSLLSGAWAYPAVPHMNAERLDTPATAVSQAEGNCGSTPCLVFNAEEQLISVSGTNAWLKPSPDDERGPCPGLNAAANHGYIPRSGLLHFGDAILGLQSVYQLGGEFTAFLAAYSIAQSGDIASMTWSIGGPFNFANPGGLLTPPQGLAYTHNAYEGDVSIGRNDAYTNHGDAYTLNLTRFISAYNYRGAEDRLTLDKFRQNFREKVYWSIADNAYYFSPPFAGAAVAPAAYNFVINFMSNHTADEPNGYLNGDIFKSFFAVYGPDGKFTHKEGFERIPNNWYRRTGTNPYDAARTGADVGIGWAAYPDGFRIGGNTNGVNTYTGIDVSDLTGGTFNAKNLLQGNNAGCFMFLAAEQAYPDEFAGTGEKATKSLALISKFTAPILSKLQCPQLAKYDYNLFSQFPGHTYRPKAPGSKRPRGMIFH